MKQKLSLLPKVIMIIVWFLIVLLCLVFLFPKTAQSTDARYVGLTLASISILIILISFFIRSLKHCLFTSDRAIENLIRSFWLLLVVLLLYLMATTYISADNVNSMNIEANSSLNTEISTTNASPPSDTNKTGEEASSDPFQQFFTAVSKAWQWISLRYALNDVAALMQVSIWYKTTVYLTCLTIVLNSVFLSYALLGRTISMAMTRFVWEWRRIFSRDLYMIIGNNEENLSLYDSLDSKTRKRYRAVIADDINKEGRERLFEKGIRYLNQSPSPSESNTDKKSTQDNPSVTDLNKFLTAKYPKNSKRIVVINTGDDVRNIELCRVVCKYVNEAISAKGPSDARSDESKEKKIHLFSQLEVYAFGDIKHEAIFNQISNESKGVVRYVNKYRQIAMDFVKRYPLPLFMDQSQLDYKTGLVNNGVDINVCLIGFGDINQQLFSTLVATNQFIQKGTSNIPSLKPVKYHIFDHAEARKNKNLNHSYYRYMNEFYQENDIRDYCAHPDHAYQYPTGADLQKHLEKHIAVNLNAYRTLPHFPAEEFYHVMDINDPEFYHELRDIGLGNPCGINYFIIAYGSDVENVDMAQKVREKMLEWEISNIRIFTRTKKRIEINEFLRGSETKIFDEADCTDAFGTQLNDVCFTFGCERETVFTANNLFKDNWYKATLHRHCMQECEKKMRDANGKLDPNKAPYHVEDGQWNEEYCEWYVKKGTIGRDSCLLGALGIRPKMLMIGYDIDSKGEWIDTCSYKKKIRETPAKASSLHDQNPTASAPPSDPPSEQPGNDSVISVTKTLEAPTSHDIPSKPMQEDYHTNMFIDSQGSVRDNLAVQEHYRWCAFEISRGVVPATIDQSRGDKEKPCGRDYRMRRHGCLTTVEGLNEMISQGGTDDERKNYYHSVSSNYWAMDDALWFLSLLEMGIVRKHDPNATAGSPDQTSTTNP